MVSERIRDSFVYIKCYVGRGSTDSLRSQDIRQLEVDGKEDLEEVVTINDRNRSIGPLPYFKRVGSCSLL